MGGRAFSVVALLVCICVVVEASRVSASTRAAAEVAHYQRLWASSKHTANIAGKRSWKCCRACAQKTVPLMHEAFEGDKDDKPDPTPSPPKDGAKSFLEIAVEHGAKISRPNSYSCCNICPDMMAPFPRTWNDPSPYSYVPKPLFRFKQQHNNNKQRLLAPEAEAEAEDASLIELGSNSKSKSEAGTESESEWYVPTNPHDLPIYPYFMSWLKAARARSKAAREGKWDAPIRPGASPIWHPPPPPHDDIYRITRSPNLHDGSDLKTSFVMPPCCDFCMSTYFPHIINDELQLPQLEPYQMAKVQALVETDAAAAAVADAAEDAAEEAAESEEDESLEAQAARAQVNGNDEDAALLQTGSNARADPAMTSAAAFAANQPGAKSDPHSCCHKCVRKDIEDTDWHVYALPEKPRRRHRYHY